MNWLFGASAGCLVAQVALWPQQGPVWLKLRTTASPIVFELEVGNRSGERVDVALPVRLTLVPKEAALERYPRRSTLWSTVDPQTGQFAEEGHSVRLRLEASGSRTFRIDLRELMWSLGPKSVWTPRELWQMVEAGPYELSAFILGGSPRIAWSAGPVLVELESE